MAWPKSAGKQWQPGQSGNPSGRAPIAREFQERCRNFMDAEGWAELERMAKSRKSEHHMRALELVTAYAVGKPMQRQEVSGPDGRPIAYTDMSWASEKELAALVDLGKRAQALIEAEKSGKA